MKKSVNATGHLVSKAGEDSEFRARLLAKPRETIEQELGVTLAADHEIHVYEDTDAVTHLVLPPQSKLSEAERKAAMTGVTSLEYLRKTLHDPAPPARPPAEQPAAARNKTTTPEALVAAGRESIRRGLDFLESAVDEQGIWQAVRFNISNPDVPRHFEKIPFISALGVLALKSCEDARAKAICSRTREYLSSTIEYPGFWRYWRHLPQDLDSSASCSLAIGTHPWIMLGRNLERILANRDERGRFMTWILAQDEPNAMWNFRHETDPVVNANVIAYLGDHPETRDAQRWLESSIAQGSAGISSNWYPDVVAIYYAIARAGIYAKPAFDQLRPILADCILGLRDDEGGFGNILQTAQAVSALYNIGSLESTEAQRQIERFVSSQREDGSWPEYLAWGDHLKKWGAIGHGSEALTTSYCIEALERLIENPKT